MTPFFRNIRKKMADDNKPMKYVRYAIGEILLVVIGILIALQINNWNDERLEKIEERKLISNINQEFVNNLKNLDSTILHIDTLVPSLSLLMLSMSEPSSNVYKGEKLNELLVNCSQIPPKWKRSDINVKGIESSDNLGRIKNEKLKQLLYNWFGINENVKAMEQSGEAAFLTYINYIKENGSWREIDKLANFGNAISGGSILMPDNDHLLLDYKFENVVDDHLAWLLNRNREYRATRVHLEKIINESLKPNSTE